jgi:hypothetical protein
MFKVEIIIMPCSVNKAEWKRRYFGADNYLKALCSRGQLTGIEKLYPHGSQYKYSGQFSIQNDELYFGTGPISDFSHASVIALAEQYGYTVPGKEDKSMVSAAWRFLQNLYIKSSTSVLRAPNAFCLVRKGETKHEPGLFSIKDGCELVFNGSERINFRDDYIISLAISLGFIAS